MVKSVEVDPQARMRIVFPHNRILLPSMQVASLPRRATWGLRSTARLFYGAF